MRRATVSFIIPALNEANNIRATLDAICMYCPDIYDSEIIVVDHGSADRTREIAGTIATQVIDGASAATIGELRNRGAGCAEGSILVFLDADVRLTGEWSAEFPSVYSDLEDCKSLIVGSRVEIPANPSWIERIWFQNLIRGENAHIGTGHMILRRDFFFEVGAFDTQLATGEDYEFSMRAKFSGASLEKNSNLRVCHYGYPKNIRQFFLREAWHGLGDVGSFGAFTNSRIAQIGVVFLLGFIAVPLLIFQSVIWLALILTILSAIALAASFRTFSHCALCIQLFNGMLYAIYFAARGASVVMRLVPISSWRKT